MTSRPKKNAPCWERRSSRTGSPRAAARARRWRAPHTYSQPNAASPMTVLQWIVQLVHPTWATGWTTASAASDGAKDITSDTYCAAEGSARLVRSGAGANSEMSEEEHQADERDHGDDERPGEQRAE